MCFLLEKILTVEQKIRRAEEVYNRRKIQNGIRVASSSVNSNSRSSFNLFKKTIIKILICTIIYLLLIVLKNSGILFSQQLISETQKILSYDVDFFETYNIVIEFFSNNIIESQMENIDQNNIIEIDNKQENNENNNIENNPQTETVNDQVDGNVEDIAKTEMEIDAEYIKSNFNFIIPVQGIVTSKFGKREETDIVSENHKGIDVGANTGTHIYAAMEGMVTVVENSNSYGNYLKINNKDVVTVYAHCSKIDVVTGQYVTQGQKIAEVGETGNATGPHLHFEVQREGRLVNPEYILKF